MSEHLTLDQEKQTLIQTLMNEIDELLAMRQGFPQAYRQWVETMMSRVREAFGDELADELEQKGPRQVPVNRQHRVHIFRQRLHAQRRFLEDLLEQSEQAD